MLFSEEMSVAEVAQVTGQSKVNVKVRAYRARVALRKIILNDMDDDRRIIRIELSKESLASLGVYIPLMNENEKIKSDLLISSDGVPQAIRFVKNSKNDFKRVRKYEKGS